MEQLLHYVWKHRLYAPTGLSTTDGRPVEVIDPGLHNHDAGPDFFNAKVRIGGTLWVGCIEIHSRSSDWKAHGHDTDRAYDNVVLHVAETVDCPVTDSEGRDVPQMQLSVPPRVAESYAELLATDAYPPCWRTVPRLSRITVSSWLAALQAERLSQKTEAIVRRAEAKGGSWEEAFFVTMARNYGFGVNGDAFEQWAMCVPLSAAAHHRDDLFQVEALFLGQAGLLSDEALPRNHRDEARNDGYLAKMQAEYAFLAHKFGLKPMDARQWKFLRLRPQSFPHIRISQLAALYHSRRADLSRLVECTSVDDIKALLGTQATEYWQTHYTFGAESKRSAKRISGKTLELLAINTAIPTLFAYGRHTLNEALCQRAVEMLEGIKAEDNHIIRMWREVGLDARNAADTQALVQLKREYCDRRDCLRCRFGYETLKADAPEAPEQGMPKG